MGPEFWSIISVGIVIPIAVATANRATRRELGGRIDAMHLEMNKRFGEVNERFGKMDGCIAALHLEMSERFGKVNERLGRAEGLLEGIGYAQRKQAGKERGVGGSALPRS